MRPGYVNTDEVCAARAVGGREPGARVQFADTAFGGSAVRIGGSRAVADLADGMQIGGPADAPGALAPRKKRARLNNSERSRKP